MKIAIIGLGRVYQHYKNNFIPYIRKNLHELYLCDIDKEKLSKETSLNKSIGIKNINELINHSIDIAIVSTPSGIHFSQTKLLLENGINVLTEKPATMKITELEELIKIAEQRNLKYGVFFQNRFNKAIRKVKEAAHSNIFGSIKLCSIKLHWCREQNYYEDGWHGTWKNDGGVINQQAIHHIDALTYIGGDIEKVFSLSENLSNQLEAEDTMLALVRFKNNSVGTIEVTTAIRPEDTEASISIFGEKGFAKVGGIAMNKLLEFKINDSNNNKFNCLDYSTEVKTGYGESHILVLEDFIYSVKNNVYPTISASSTIPTTRVVHSLYASSENNKWISLDNKIESKLLGN
tara:strand:- start:3343 stop:4386 length:1044 start_codon:yes stop_codon:yes gene_type:complete